MLSEVILRWWRESIAIPDRVRAMAQQEVKAARDFFEELRRLDSDAIRSRLSQADNKLNRNLAWLLLDEALNVDPKAEGEEAQRLIEWSEFIAPYGGWMENRSDNLEANVKFYRGALQHRRGALAEAALLYAQAEIDYRDHESPVPHALAIYAQGTIALERSNEEGISAAPGAREYFRKALDLFDQTPHKDIRDGLKGLIERSLSQWQLAGKLVRSDQPETLLHSNTEMIDLQLHSFLKAQTINLALDNQPVAVTAQAASLTDNIASQLQQPGNASEELLKFYWWRKDMEAAVWLIREQLKKKPGDLELQKALARALILQSKNHEALELLTELVQVHPNDALIQSTTGTLLLMQNDATNAEHRFRRALELDPEEAGALEGLRAIERTKPVAGMHFKDGNLTISGDISNLAPDDLAAGMTAAILAANPETIESQLKEIGKSDPQLAQRVVHLLQRQGVLRPAGQPPAIQHYRRAEQFFGEGRWQEAISEYSQAIEAEPNFAEAYMGWGDVYYRTGNYNLAIAYFEESNSIKPAPSTYRFLGDAYARINKRKLAEESYRQALKLDPNYRGARDSLRQLLETGE